MGRYGSLWGLGQPLITSHMSYRSHRPLQAGLQKCNPCYKGVSELKEIKENKEINEADRILNIFNIVKIFKLFIRIAQPKLILHFEFYILNF